MSEAEAASLVGATSFQDLSGGRDGTASTLIDALDSRQKTKRLQAPLELRES
jgi:hypothetical protein